MCHKLVWMKQIILTCVLITKRTYVTLVLKRPTISKYRPPPPCKSIKAFSRCFPFCVSVSVPSRTELVRLATQFTQYCATCYEWHTFFFKFFVGHMSALFKLCGGICDIHSLRFTSGMTPLLVYMVSIAASHFPHMHVSAEVGCWI